MVNHDKRIAFVSSIKCATNTTYAVLTRHGYERVGQGFHETNTAHVRAKGYHVFTVARNPYERAASVWTSMVARMVQVGYNDRYGLTELCPEAEHSFKAFASWLVDNWQDATHYPKLEVQRALAPLAVYHNTLTQCEHFARFEYLQEDLSQITGITFDQPLPRYNASAEHRYEGILDQETVDILTPWAEVDCIKYGYSVGTL